MKFDRKKFFDAYNHSFGELNQYEVNGLNRLLRLYEKYDGWWDNIDQIGNSLAQIKHETAHSFNPVVEGYYLGNAKDTPENYFHGNNLRVQRFQQKLKYFPYYGIGDIQLTWLHNFEKHEKLLRIYFPEIVRDFEARTGEKLDLVKHPRQVLDGEISFAIMTIGMHIGTFTGKKLDNYNLPNGFDHFNARSIVNGDKNYPVKNSNLTVGQQIARTAEKFVEILNQSLIKVPVIDLNDEIELEIPEKDSVTATGSNSPLPQNISSASDNDQVAENNPVVKPVENLQSTPVPDPNLETSSQTSIVEKISTFGTKAQETASQTQTTIETVTSTYSKVSGSSVFAFVWKNILALLAFLAAFIQDNWEWIVVGVVILLIAAWLWNEAKSRSNDRTMTALKK